MENCEGLWKIHWATDFNGVPERQKQVGNMGIADIHEKQQDFCNRHMWRSNLPRIFWQVSNWSPWKRLCEYLAVSDLYKSSHVTRCSTDDPSRKNCASSCTTSVRFWKDLVYLVVLYYIILIISDSYHSYHSYPWYWRWSPKIPADIAPLSLSHPRMGQCNDRIRKGSPAIARLLSGKLQKTPTIQTWISRLSVGTVAVVILENIFNEL